MSYQNELYTIHLEEHSEPVADCDYCESWPPADWTKKDLEQYAETMQREMASRKE